MVEKRTFNLWVMLTPAPEAPGEWDAHCLDLNVVTQGTSLPHAFTMALEAIGMTLAEDLAAGFEPTDRRAPQKYWDEMWEVARHGSPSTLEQALQSAGPQNVVIVTVEFKAEAASQRLPQPLPQAPQAPLALVAPEQAHAA